MDRALSVVGWVVRLALVVALALGIGYATDSTAQPRHVPPACAEQLDAARSLIAHLRADRSLIEDVMTSWRVRADVEKLRADDLAAQLAASRPTTPEPAK